MFHNLDERELAQHVTILGWLLIVSNLVMAIIGGFVLFLLAGIGVLSGEFEAFAILSVVGIFVAGLLVVLALPGVLAGFGLLRRRSWGRILGIVVAFLSLLNFPLGTAIGVYGLWVLFQESAVSFFNGVQNGAPGVDRAAPPASS